jgi:prolyl oligopeptidase
VWFDFNSINYPPRLYEYDTRAGKLTPWRVSDAPVRSEDFEVKQVWYESRDRTSVPMFLAHRKGIRLDGANPVLVNGYGGFNLSRRPTFSTDRIVWMEAGGVLALPGLRGGGEFGEKWHEAGMLERKQNVFDDFIAAIEWLIHNKYTSPPRVAISGGSNGGLLVGAVATQRPDLFQAAICGAPLLDMIRYHKFLVARWWIPEYGSSDNPKQLHYLLRYSPYHNVKKGVEYPAMLFVTGDSDSRVHPLHARKMTALMQASTSSERPILLHYDTRTGHSRAKPTERIIADTADELTFMFSQLNIDYQPH